MIKNLFHLSFMVIFFTSFIAVGSEKGTAQQEGARSRQLLEDLYTIRSVAVDETARSASVAQRAAIAKAEQLAYQTLLEKLTQPEDRAKLPELNQSEIQRLIRGIEVIDEQSSSRRYLATYNIVFEPEFVSDFLGFHQVPHVLSTGPGIAVIHAHRSGITDYFWLLGGPVITAREAIDWENRIRFYKFPDGSIADRFTMTQKDVEKLSADSALKIAKNYGLNSALIVYSELQECDEGDTLSLRYRFLSTDGNYQGEGIEFQMDSFSRNESELLVTMYRSILETVDSEWRKQLLVDTSESGDLKVLVTLDSAESFGKITSILSEISLIKNYQIDHIAIPVSEMSITYTGRLEQLSLALNYNGLNLTQYGDQWLISQKTDRDVNLKN